MSEAVIVSGVRTAIGNFGGALKDVPAFKLGSIVIREAMKRAGLRPVTSQEVMDCTPDVLKSAGAPEVEQKNCIWDSSLNEVQVDEVIMGNVLQAGQGQNPARQASIYGGIPKESNAFTVNKVCASGMKATALAAQAIKAGDAECIIAGGMENMSAVPYYIPKARWGIRMNNAEIVDGMVHDGLWESFHNYHMGLTAENIAAKMNISRKEQDEFSLTSNQRALAAIKNGIFKQEIIPVEIRERREVKLFDTDEHPRETSIEQLTKLPPVFKSDGTITAGSASGITDAAAAMVVMSADKAKQLGLKPMAYVRAYASGGLDPAFMGLGPVPSTLKVLKIAGISLKDIQVVELNEAFASQSIGVVRELRMSMDRVNPYGGGISLGHPIGCTGARILVTLIYEMQRKNYQWGLATLCIGGGQGMSMILENPQS